MPSDIEDEFENDWLAICKEADYFEDNKDYEKAINVYEKMLEMFPSRRYSAWFCIGLAKRRSNDYEGAIEAYTQSIKHFPDYRAYANRASVYILIDEEEKAFNDLEEALKLKPDDFVALLHRGSIHCEKGNFREGLIDLDKAINNSLNIKTSDPKVDKATAYRRRGAAKYELEDKKGAFADWTKAAEMGDKKASQALKIYSNN